MLHLGRKWTATLLVLGSLLFATHAQAIQYFNVTAFGEDFNFGFDNSSLALTPDYLIPDDATFECIEFGTSPCPPPLDLELDVVQQVDDPNGGIDRTITWTLTNLGGVSDFLIFFTQLGDTPYDYSDAVIDIDIDGADPMMDVISFGPYFFAGYRLTLDDFTMVNGSLEATRTFRYTVDEPEQGGFPPELGIAYTTEFTVPEPATGLLLGTALLMILGTGRRHDP